ncbi:hypothetical protein [Pseudomonas sediminis]|uniref:hypothetical protein n=1 Tax=Pseudomonas sediminis TaxID=1691904 RepID=UPI0013041064|nr:hypothetical protein [Pseudomonas sediminis]
MKESPIGIVKAGTACLASAIGLAHRFLPYVFGSDFKDSLSVLNFKKGFLKHPRSQN